MPKGRLEVAFFLMVKKEEAIKKLNTYLLIFSANSLMGTVVCSRLAKFLSVTAPSFSSRSPTITAKSACRLSASSKALAILRPIISNSTITPELLSLCAIFSASTLSASLTARTRTLFSTLPASVAFWVCNASATRSIRVQRQPLAWVRRRTIR